MSGITLNERVREMSAKLDEIRNDSSLSKHEMSEQAKAEMAKNRDILMLLFGLGVLKLTLQFTLSVAVFYFVYNLLVSPMLNIPETTLWGAIGITAIVKFVRSFFK